MALIFEVQMPRVHLSMLPPPSLQQANINVHSPSSPFYFGARDIFDIVHRRRHDIEVYVNVDSLDQCACVFDTCIHTIISCGRFGGQQ